MNLANHRWIQVAVLLLLAQAAAAQVAPIAYDPEYVIVRFEGPTTLAEAQRVLDKSQYLVTEALVPSRDIFLVRLSSGITVPEATTRLKQEGKVRWVQPDHWMDLRSTTPDDPQFPSQWNMQQPSDCDIDAPEAWDLATGGEDPGGNEIVVAAVDNGAYMDHLDLAPNIWVNREEIPGNGVDDEGNGYIDDINGWDAFYSDGTIPIPATSHGTHVTGIIGACGNNSRQVAGTNWRVRVMVVAASSSKTSVVARGYNYVLAQKQRWLSSGGLQGANVVATNSSFGVNYGNCQADSFPIWNDLYNAMGQAGILSAAATANLAIDVDLRGDVPTGCSSRYLISVTNTTDADVRSSSAAWGDTTIDLGAPGTSILSTINTGTGLKSGTSMASPHVAGAVALLHAAASPSFYVYYMAHPDSAALYLKQVLLDSVDVLAGFDTLTVSGGRLNLYRAASAIHSFTGSPPVAPMLVYAGQMVEDQVTGDADSVLEAGETARLIVTVADFGAEATGVNAVLRSGDPYLSINDSTATYGTIPAGGSADNVSDPFDVEADTSAPLEHQALITLHLTADGGYSADRYFYLTLGQGVIYFSFDGESGDSGWTHAAVTPGFGDQWHLSTEMSSSPIHSWKCGSTGTGGIALHLDAGLVSPEVDITPYSTLYYSHWMDAEPSTVYGDSAYDGGIIEVAADGGPFEQVIPAEGHVRSFCTIRKSLPYTGPMPGQPCYSGTIYWMQSHVDLSTYAGQTIQVRFRFGSDNDTIATEEGWYVDDIFIRGQSPIPPTVDPVEDVVILPVDSSLQLFWTAPVTGADYYVIYRNSQYDFDPGPADSIGFTSDTTYTDVNGATVGPESFYVVKARKNWP